VPRRPSLLLEDDDPLATETGEVPGRRGSCDACSDDDAVGRSHVNLLLVGLTVSNARIELVLGRILPEGREGRGSAAVSK